MLDNQSKFVLFFLVIFSHIGLIAQSDNDIYYYSPNFEYSSSKVSTTSIKEQFSNRINSVLPSFNNSLRVNSLLDSIYSSNKLIKFIEGYRIQVYSGENKDLANKAKELVYKIFPNADIYLVYKQPTYRVKLGDFTDKLEAVRILEAKIKKPFPKAFLINDYVFIKKK